MKKEEYLKMNLNELYDKLISYVLENPTDAEEVLENLEFTERYKADYEFRASIGTARVVLLGMCGKIEELIPQAMHLIETTTALEMWQLVSTNWNMLGTSYFSLDIFERALECYYKVIEIAKKHGFQSMLSIAYNNIAQLYISLDDYREAYQYLLLAISKLEEAGENQTRYCSKFIAYYSNVILALCKLKQYDEVPCVFKKMESVNLDKITINAKCNYYIAQMHYAFSILDFDTAREIYYELNHLVRKHNPRKVFSVVSAFLELCLMYGLGYEYYIEELLALIEWDVLGSDSENLLVYRELRNYYRTQQDLESAEKIGDRYIDFLEQNDKKIKSQRQYSLQVMKKLIENKENIEHIETKNIELRLIAEEAVKNKDALQLAYRRIGIINELGRKLTSSLNLKEVLGLIYKNLKDNLPVDAFVLMVVDKEENCLRSLAYYEDEELQEGFSIDLNDKDSIFADCYRLNGIISSNDPKYEQYFERHMQIQDDADMQSAIFMTLDVEDEIIGLCSIQCREKKAFTNRETEFLEQFLPYLSIALNNAIHSMVLEKEIQSHLETRAKLEAANKRLEKISSLDGLTQISSRRDFDMKVVEILEESKMSNKEIAVFMIDIDDFKLYNDTYGHLEGDEALKKVAKVFRKNMDETKGLSARFGGEEFIGACLGLDYDSSFALAEKIREDVSRLGIEHKVTRLGKVTVSIGVAITGETEKKKRSDLLRSADEALYRAKNNGKNKVEVVVL